MEKIGKVRLKKAIFANREDSAASTHQEQKHHETSVGHIRLLPTLR